jgi:hypothetical protein
MSENVIWRVHRGAFGRDYYAQRIVNGMTEDERDFSSHCLACAKAEIMMKTGEPADIRGWHMQGMCGSFLKAMSISLAQEDEDGA